LAYKWSFIKKPADSIATLSDPTAAKPTFVADKVGEYVAQLIVNDGALDSKPDTVLIKVSNPPVSDVSVNLWLKVEPSTLLIEKFGKSVGIKAKVKVLNPVEHSSIPLLVDVSVKKPDNTMQTLGQKRIWLKESYTVEGHYTPKMAGTHTVYVVISDQAGNPLSQQSKPLTVILNNDDDDDYEEEDEHEDEEGDD